MTEGKPAKAHWWSRPRAQDEEAGPAADGLLAHRASDDGDYELRYDGASWSLRDLRSGSAVTLTGTGTPADPLVGDGLELTISGAANAGDRFLVRPTALAAGDMQVAISDPARVAAASPLRAAASVGNTGSATVSTPTR